MLCEVRLQAFKNTASDLAFRNTTLCQHRVFTRLPQFEEYNGFCIYLNKQNCPLGLYMMETQCSLWSKTWIFNFKFH